MRPVFNKFLTSLLGKSPAPHRRSRPARKNRCDRRLKMEFLEDRLVLSTVTVTTNIDSLTLPGSLRYEIAHAASGDTIKFASNVHNIALSPTLGEARNLPKSGYGRSRGEQLDHQRRQRQSDL